VLLRGFALEAFKIPSGSMLPTLQIGDYVLVDKLRYGVRLGRRWLLRYGAPAPGDVVVFTDRKDPTLTYVKRVVAMPGEVVEIRDKQVLVNGVPRDVPTAYFTQRSHVQNESSRDNFGPARVPRRRLFVLGDNRDQSFDSRFWGFANIDDIKGKATFVYWSRDVSQGWLAMPRFGRFGTFIE